jgi:hypothetical protein
MLYIAATHRRLLRTALHVTVLLLLTAPYVVSQPQTRSEDEAAAYRDRGTRTQSRYSEGLCLQRKKELVRSIATLGGRSAARTAAL